MRPLAMGFACLLCLSVLGAQGDDFFDTPESMGYQQQLASLTSYEVVATTFKPGICGRIWSRRGELRVRVGDKFTSEPRQAGYGETFSLRNHRLQWYEVSPWSNS